MSSTSSKPRSASIFAQAFTYSVPVLLGYVDIGTAFGLFVSDAGYPVWLALFMSLWMFAGAAQFIAVGLFVAGTSLWEACLIQLMVNARHMAYGFSMFNRFPQKSFFKPYLIFSLTDEPFALLSSLPSDTQEGVPPPGKERDRFMLYVSVLDQCYWLTGSLIGATVGSLIPFDMEGIGFALTALFIVLMIEQICRVKKPSIFIVSGLAALLAVFLLPERITLLAGIIMALLFSFLFELCHRQYTKGKTS
jgi:4-azaleucine resistance transporter AzlC